jgi:hypothetical protein
MIENPGRRLLHSRSVFYVGAVAVTYEGRHEQLSRVGHRHITLDDLT